MVKGVPAEPGCLRTWSVEQGRSTGVEIPWLLSISLPQSRILLGNKGPLWSLANVFGSVPLYLREESISSLSVFPPQRSWRHPKESSSPFLSPGWTKVFSPSLSRCTVLQHLLYLCGNCCTFSMESVAAHFQGVKTGHKSPDAARLTGAAARRKTPKFGMKWHKRKSRQLSLLESSEALALVLSWTWQGNSQVNGFCVPDTDFSKRRHQRVAQNQVYRTVPQHCASPAGEYPLKLSPRDAGLDVFLPTVCTLSPCTWFSLAS